MANFEFGDFKGIPLFIYGTLKSNKRNRSVVDDFVERYIDVVAQDVSLASETYGLPMMFRSHGAQVKGELTYLKESTAGLAANRLDFFEGAPYMYQRELVQVKVDDKTINAWAYLYSKNIPAGFNPQGLSEWKGA